MELKKKPKKQKPNQIQSNSFLDSAANSKLTEEVWTVWTDLVKVMLIVKATAQFAVPSQSNHQLN